SLASSLAGSYGRSGEPSALRLYESLRHPIVLAVFCRLARLGCHARDRYLDLGDSAPRSALADAIRIGELRDWGEKEPRARNGDHRACLTSLIRWWPAPAAPARRRNPPIANL